MRCANLSDDWLWRAIAQNTESLSALIHLELGEADPASMHPRVTGMKYDVGTTFKHPWVRNQTDKKPTSSLKHDLLLTSENVHQRFGHRFTRGSLIFNTNRIL